MRVNLPAGCMALESATGHKYTDPVYHDRRKQPRIGLAAKKRSRSVEVTDSRDLALVRQSKYLVAPGYRFSDPAGWDCACGRGNWSWSTTCAKCGREKES